MAEAVEETGMTLDDVLAELDGRGVGFEALSMWFLLNDPEWSSRFQRAWRWSEWPGRWGPDRGIDLVAEAKSGELAAVQCKNLASEHTITKSGIDSFLSESSREEFAERIVIASTSRLSTGAEEVIAAQEKPVRLVLRERLLEADLDWAAFTDAVTATPARKQPRPDQERALGDVLRGLSRAERGQLLMPCGTGKTLTSVWVAERLQSRRTLVLVPTLALLRQTARVWRAEIADTAMLKVCSDKAGDDRDEIVAADHTAAEVAPVTTDATEIAEFLRRPGRQVIIATYDSSMKIADALALTGDVEFDLVIADEAHHCAGFENSPRKAVLDNEKIRARRRLFVTATPTMYTAEATERAASAHARVASMDDHHRFGRVAHRLSFKRAVEQGLLCPYQVLLMPVRDEEVAELVRRRRTVTPDGEHVTDAYNLAAQIACLRTMRRHGCRRLVAFHPRVEQSQRFAGDVVMAAQLLDEDERPDALRADHVDGYMRKGRREAILDRFAADDDAHHLLSNVRLLAEGVDVPEIDAICLVDTHRNPAAIVQAVGRAVRTAEGKTVGTILLPLLLEQGQSVEDAMRSDEHRPVLEVLAALRSLDTEIVNTVDAIQIELGPRPPSSRGGSWVLDAAIEVRPGVRRGGRGRVRRPAQRPIRATDQAAQAVAAA